ncbi:MAG: zinc dependent phospholipase C family protein [Candidatus Coprovivens sp.]
MPSLITHHMFSKEVLKHLKNDELNKFNQELTIYHTFAQSHDYLFYYTFDIKNFKRIKDFGHYAHRNKTQEYLINIVKEIKNNHLENNHQIIAYLYGSITHYVLDSTCHPYIFYKTGVYRKKEKDTKKYHGEHNRIEKDLDAIYYEKYTNKKLNQCNVSKEIISNPILSQELINTINSVYEKTYNKKNIGLYYKKSIKHAKIIYNIFINDYLGIKKLIYSFLDFISFNHFGYIAAYSTYRKHPNLKYLNIEKKEWNHPSLPELKYNYSFEELYNKSLYTTLIIINKINQVLYENQSIDSLYKYIPDLDYSTGLLIKNSKIMRYFEY